MLPPSALLRLCQHCQQMLFAVAPAALTGRLQQVPAPRLPPPVPGLARHPQQLPAEPVSAVPCRPLRGPGCRPPQLPAAALLHPTACLLQQRPAWPAELIGAGTLSTAAALPACAAAACLRQPSGCEPQALVCYRLQLPPAAAPAHCRAPPRGGLALQCLDAG